MNTRVKWLVAALLCSASAANAQQISDDRVVLATATDLSGSYSDTAGKSSVEAIKMAIDEFGGSVLGKPIVHLVADHQNKADVASKLVREWIADEKADALVDVITTPAALASQRLANENGIISLFSGSGSTDLINDGCSELSFLWDYESYTTAAASGLGVAQGQKGQKWFMISVDYAFGHQLEQYLSDVVKKEGGEVVGSVRHPFGNTDFSSYLLQAKASGADVIGLVTSSADLVNLVKQSDEYGVRQGGQKLAAVLMFINDVDALGLDAAQGILTTQPFYWNRTPESTEWSRRFFERYGKMPNDLNAGAYSMTRHYLKAVEAAGTDDPKTVAAKMRELPIEDFFALNGHIREDGRMVHDVFLARVKTPDQSKEPWDYFQILATVPGDQVAFPLERSTCKLVKQ